MVIQQQGPQNSATSWKRIRKHGIRATKQVVTGVRSAAEAPAQAQRRRVRGQGLKTLQREATLITAKAIYKPCSQAKWSWDCLAQPTALAGRFVPASANAFSHRLLADNRSCGIPVQVEKQNEFPQGLKPGFQAAAIGTAEAVPLQSAGAVSLQSTDKRGLRGWISGSGSTD